MDKNSERPIWQLTEKELLDILEAGKTDKKNTPISAKNYVYGLKGLTDLFKCSVPTALKIKKSGIIDGAISQVGKKMIIDADLALELSRNSNKNK